MPLTQSTVQTTAALRRFNRKSVLTEICLQSKVSRTGLVAATGLTNAGVSRIIRELITAGLVKEGSQLPRLGLPGRKETELSISSSVAHIIGVSLHVDSRQIVLANTLGEIKDQVDLDVELSEPPDLVVARIGDLVVELITRNNLQKQQVIGIALALAGKIDPLRGVLKESRIYQWKDLAIRDLLRAKVKIPVAIENLNNVINFAESYFGQSQGCDNVLTFRVGTGYVGASLMLDGKLVRTRNSAAGLIHHVPMNASELACECGQRGCINTVSSGFGILAHYNRQKYVAFTPGDSIENNEQIIAILDAAEKGDPRACKILRHGGEVLGQYAAQLTSAIYPEAIVIAGKIGRSTSYMEGFDAAWNRYAAQENQAAVQVFRSSKSVIEATVQFAIHRFLLSMDLDLEPLKAVFNAPDQKVA